MRTFEILNSENPSAPPCAVLTCNQKKGEFDAEVNPWAGVNDVPVQFAPTVEKGETGVPRQWVKAWVDERVVPPSRQNIGSVLKEHSLRHYDICELLAQNEGRSVQDGFYLREVTDSFRESAVLGRLITEERNIAGLSQKDLAKRCGMSQESLSRLESGNTNPTMKTLENIATALGKTLHIGFE